jgi:hypothetical protein
MRVADARRSEQHHVFRAFDERQMAQLGEHLQSSEGWASRSKESRLLSVGEMRQIGAGDCCAFDSNGEFVAKEWAVVTISRPNLSCRSGTSRNTASGAWGARLSPNE